MKVRDSIILLSVGLSMWELYNVGGQERTRKRSRGSAAFFVLTMQVLARS